MVSDGGARVALIIHPGDVAFRPGAFYVGVYSQLGGVPTCYPLATCYSLLATYYLLLATCYACYLGDYILSADVLEPSVDVPGLNAVSYTYYMTMPTLAMLTVPMRPASARWAMLIRWAAGCVAECALTATV